MFGKKESNRKTASTMRYLLGYDEFITIPMKSGESLLDRLGIEYVYCPTANIANGEYDSRMWMPIGRHLLVNINGVETLLSIFNAKKENNVASMLTYAKGLAIKGDIFIAETAYEEIDGDDGNGRIDPQILEDLGLAVNVPIQIRAIKCSVDGKVLNFFAKGVLQPRVGTKGVVLGKGMIKSGNISGHEIVEYCIIKVDKPTKMNSNFEIALQYKDATPWLVRTFKKCTKYLAMSIIEFLDIKEEGEKDNDEDPDFASMLSKLYEIDFRFLYHQIVARAVKSKAERLGLKLARGGAWKHTSYVLLPDSRLKLDEICCYDLKDGEVYAIGRLPVVHPAGIRNMLNRHLLDVAYFNRKLLKVKAIFINPAVASIFQADFDGDYVFADPVLATMMRSLPNAESLDLVQETKLNPENRRIRIEDWVYAMKAAALHKSKVGLYTHNQHNALIEWNAGKKTITEKIFSIRSETKSMTPKEAYTAYGYAIQVEIDSLKKIMHIPPKYAWTQNAEYNGPYFINLQNLFRPQNDLTNEWESKRRKESRKFLESLEQNCTNVMESLAEMAWNFMNKLIKQMTPPTIPLNSFVGMFGAGEPLTAGMVEYLDAINANFFKAMKLDDVRERIAIIKVLKEEVRKLGAKMTCKQVAYYFNITHSDKSRKRNVALWLVSSKEGMKDLVVKAKIFEVMCRVYPIELDPKDQDSKAIADQKAVLRAEWQQGIQLMVGKQVEIVKKNWTDSKGVSSDRFYLKFDSLLYPIYGKEAMKLAGLPSILVTRTTICGVCTAKINIV